MRAFISYSHRDSEALERLHVHLAGLRRDNLIFEWYDREILAGDVLDDQISQELEQADLFLLLVSPDFIASDYCVDKELGRALERHEAGTARVIPIIVEPCDWASMSSLHRLKALPHDAKPLSEWANANTAYLNVVQEIRRVCEEARPKERQAEQPVTKEDTSNTSRYRIQRDFDDIDRSEFRDAAFEVTKDYFERAISEINTIDGLKGRLVDSSPVSFGCTIVNRHQTQGTAHITVHRGGAGAMMGDIFWSFEENSSPSSANGWVNVSSDEYEQFLEGLGSFHGQELKHASPVQFAENLWEQLIEHAGITHA